MIGRASDGLFHPTSEATLVDLIGVARAQGAKLRVRGSAHSPAASILTSDAGRDLHTSLDRLTAIAFDDARQQVTVQAGCTLTALCVALDNRGWALPTTAGITHQTVAGFIATGSAGGSVRHSLSDQIVGLRVVDGTGYVHDLRRSASPSDRFYATGVSLGLLGVITEVTFQCVDAFSVIGSESTSAYADCAVDLFGPVASDRDRPTLEHFLRTAEFARLMWFPQPGVERVSVWQAHRPASELPYTRRPYALLPSIGGSIRPAQYALAGLLSTLDVLNPPEPTAVPGRVLRGVLAKAYPMLASGFLSADTQPFHDAWWRVLPMDNAVDNGLLPIQFTELWLPLEKSGEVMRELDAYYRAGGFRHTGSFGCELYAAPRSEFWLSPAFDRDVLRVNLFWFARNRGDPVRDFFPGVWRRLRPFGYRLHWGKLLHCDVAYLRQQYPRWDDFVALRSHMDPHRVFVSDYWAHHLGL